MRGWFPQVLAGHHLERGWRALALLLAAATLLELAAGTGLAFVAGFGRVHAALGHFDWRWLLAFPAAWLVSFVGYYLAYRGVFKVNEGPFISWRHLSSVAIAGFGGFLAVRGESLERYALRLAGAAPADARARVAGLSGLEQGVLAIGGCTLSILVLIGGLGRPNLSVTLLWAGVPLPGFLIAFWASQRYRKRFQGKQGWRGIIGTFLDSVYIIRELFIHPLRWGPSILGMALFWAADAFAAWAALAAFGVTMTAAALYLGFASGMLFTRRSAPLAGAGILALVLPLTISYCGAPFAVAIAGVFVYRILSLWLLMPAWLAVLPTLRAMGRNRDKDPADPPQPGDPLPRIGGLSHATGLNQGS